MHSRHVHALGFLEVHKHHTLRVRQGPIDRTLEAGNVNAQLNHHLPRQHNGSRSRS